MSQYKVIDRKTLDRMDAVIRILSGKSSVPLEAMRQGVNAEDVAEWINVSRAAITVAMHRADVKRRRREITAPCQV